MPKEGDGLNILRSFLKKGEFAECEVKGTNKIITNRNKAASSLCDLTFTTCGSLGREKSLGGGGQKPQMKREAERGLDPCGRWRMREELGQRKGNKGRSKKVAREECEMDGGEKRAVSMKGQKKLKEYRQKISINCS